MVSVDEAVELRNYRGAPRVIAPTGWQAGFSPVALRIAPPAIRPRGEGPRGAGRGCVLKNFQFRAYARECKECSRAWSDTTSYEYVAKKYSLITSEVSVSRRCARALQLIELATLQDGYVAGRQLSRAIPFTTLRRTKGEHSDSSRR